MSAFAFSPQLISTPPFTSASEANPLMRGGPKFNRNTNIRMKIYTLTTSSRANVQTTPWFQVSLSHRPVYRDQRVYYKPGSIQFMCSSWDPEATVLRQWHRFSDKFKTPTPLVIWVWVALSGNNYVLTMFVWHHVLRTVNSGSAVKLEYLDMNYDSKKIIYFLNTIQIRISD